MNYDLPDHPVIQNMERTGYPDGKEPTFPICPVCGEECEEIFRDKDLNINKFKELWREMRKELQDNDASAYSEEARKWAVDNGIIRGGNSDEFNGMWEDMMTREQLVTVLYRFAQKFGLS